MSNAGNRIGDRQRVNAVERFAGHDPGVREALDSLTALVSDLVSVPVVLVSLVDDTRQLFKGMCGLPAPWSERRQTGLSHSFCKLVAQTAEPLVIEDAREDGRVAENLAVNDLQVIAYAGFPLTDAAGFTLGSFCAIDSRPRAWSADHLTIISRCARIAEKVLFAADEQDRTQLDEVESLSRRLQRALLPSALAPSLADRVAVAYQPGSQRMLLGGDFADVLEHGGGSLGFVLGDVCGHGPESAALAIELRAAWAAIEAETPTLTGLARRLNGIAWRRGRPDSLFATALIGRMDADHREVELIRAGHEPPVLLDPSPRTLELPGGLGFGMMANSTWQSLRVSLGPAGLLAYTDGLIDGYAAPQRTTNERFGEERMLASAEAHRKRPGDDRLVDRLIRDATRAHGDELFDDVAIIHIRGPR